MIFFPLQRPQKIVHDGMTLALNRRTLAFTINLRKWLSMAPLLPLSVEQEWLLMARLLVIISAFRRRPLMPRLVGNLRNWFRNLVPVINHRTWFLTAPLWLLSVSSRLWPSSAASENGFQWHRYGPRLATKKKTTSENGIRWPNLGHHPPQKMALEGTKIWPPSTSEDAFDGTILAIIGNLKKWPNLTSS